MEDLSSLSNHLQSNREIVQDERRIINGVVPSSEHNKEKTYSREFPTACSIYLFVMFN